jgi:hypothetical protein
MRPTWRITVVGVALASLGLLAVPPIESQSRRITFSGYEWWVKSSATRVGPGPNFFSDSYDNVWVDAQGQLHLRITRRKGRWYSAEVVLAQPLGHGTYRWELANRVDNLDPNVVLGLFTWSDNPTDEHEEIDIEFARWGDAANLNAQYVVQPYSDPQNIVRFVQPAATRSIHSFLWEPTRTLFESLGIDASGQSYLIQHWERSGAGIPAFLDANARINLWLFRGRRPQNGQEVEVVITRFAFDPFPPS